MNIDLGNKRVIVTGASRDIGFAIAKAFAGEERASQRALAATPTFWAAGNGAI
jgi:NAD(P)-dependent dehydrogenase (short-subunit alcohol dehydrogenase family)